ncbi:MAG: small, acid-soluble spore protein, alpha/beta type [Clostridia bacterium]|nr:small, acid-soluble spore protein, alpha/beta type [Clostridia bacterium]
MAKSSNKSVVPEAREALNKFKMEAASDEDVQLVIKNMKK